MRFRSRTSDEPLEINLIPLIDVLLVMLIFLAATTTFTRQGVLKVVLPQSVAEANAPAPIELAISRDGQYALGTNLIAVSDPVALAQALRVAATGQTDPVVVIFADAMAAHQFVVTAMQAARQAGIARVQFATQVSD